MKKEDYDSKLAANTTQDPTEIETAQNTTTEESTKVERNLESLNTATKEILPEDLITADSKNEVRDWLIIAICVTIVSVIILLILLVLRKRIKLVVQLFKEAGKAVQNMPLILIQPLWVRIQKEYIFDYSKANFIITDVFVSGAFGCIVDGGFGLHRNCGYSRNRSQGIRQIRQRLILVLDSAVSPFWSSMVS